MPSKPKRYKPSTGANSGQVGHELLTPIVTFLLKSGLSRAQLASEFRLAIRRASASKLKVVHMDIGEEASGIVNRWLRDPIFLNDFGRPAELPLKGARSISSLARENQSDVS